MVSEQIEKVKCLLKMNETSNESNLDLTSKTGKEESRFESGISPAEVLITSQMKRRLNENDGHEQDGRLSTVSTSVITPVINRISVVALKPAVEDKLTSSCFREKVITEFFEPVKKKRKMISETVYDNAPVPKSSATSSVEESLASPTQLVPKNDTELMQTLTPDFTSSPVDDKKKDESKKGMKKWLARAVKDREMLGKG